MTREIGWRRIGKRLGQTLGFTLIEMAIVLVVIGLIVSGGLVAIAPVIENSKINETNLKLDRIEQAMVLHVIRNGCLPCPATGGTASSASGVGQAVRDTTGAYPSGCSSAAQPCTITSAGQGVVPWVNLGLSEGDITDGFGVRIAYAVTSENTRTVSGTTAGMRRDGDNYPAGTLTVNNNASTPQQITAAAAYVILSHGPDRRGGFRSSAGGTAIPTNDFSSAAEADNINGSPFVQDDAVINKDPAADVYFDDVVRWRAAPMIIQLCGAGSCGNPE